METGRATNMEHAILQSMNKRERNARTGMTNPPISCGRWCDIPVSAMEKSVIIMDDKSPGSLLVKNPSDSFLRCSASDTLPVALIS